MEAIIIVDKHYSYEKIIKEFKERYNFDNDIFKLIIDREIEQGRIINNNNYLKLSEDEFVKIRDQKNDISMKISKNHKTKIYPNIKWNSTFEELTEIYETFGRITLEYESEVNMKYLNSWICRQRKLFKLEKLSIDQVKKLNKINILNEYIEIGKINKISKWNEIFLKVKKIKDESGKLNFVNIAENEANSLKDWIYRQRYNFKRNELEPNQIKELNSLGILGNNNVIERNNDKLQKKWNETFLKVKEIKDEFGKLNFVNIAENEANFLKDWIYRQRYNFKRNELEPNQIKELNSLGILGNNNVIEKNNNKLQKKWNKAYNNLEEIYKDFGELYFEYEDEATKKYLKHWIYRQRKSFKNNELSEEQIEKLRKLNII